ncbi:MAG: McrC family protein [Rhodococcus qingshengii]|uniref:McrC family protein n=1 Tax=Rhodococcus sp. FH8 TaxID=1761013 RepID=UPI001C4F3F3E|nr:McrC family protein [Rhodococcus sp. FH8]MBW0285338.1 hypothetical protein [Rhodococcus sp. FH8]
MTAVVELREFQTKNVSAPAPPPRTREAISRDLAGRIDLQWLTDDLLRITATSWVGVARLPRGPSIHVRPKLAGSDLNVITMIGATGDIRIDDMPTIHQHVDTTTGDSAVELICQLLVSAAHDVMKRGVVRDYRAAGDDLTVMRGRLDLNRQASRHFLRVDRLACRYEEFDYDTTENRIITTALRLAGQLTSNANLRQRAWILYENFNAMAPTPFVYTPSIRKSMTYHRGNEHYRSAHVWSLALLDGISINKPFDDAGDRATTFMIDMNRLFEKFVGWLLGQMITDQITQIRAQGVNRSVLHSGDRPWGSIRPDYVVTRNGMRSAIDAKYKLYDRKSPSAADVYQLLIYSQAYRGTEGRPHSILIYPSEDSVSDFRVDLKPEGSILGSVSTVGIPLAELVQAVRSGFPLASTTTASALRRLLGLDPDTGDRRIGGHDTGQRHAGPAMLR